MARRQNAIGKTASSKRNFFPSWDDFTKVAGNDLPSGDYQILDGLPIHLRWVNKGESSTVVFFTAAAKPCPTVPIFSGNSVAQELKANSLMISDPTLILDNTLPLGWYIGNQYQLGLREQITAIIESFRTGPIVLFGGSGAGFAALDQNARLTDSTAFVANPITDLTKYGSFDELYFDKAWGATTRDEIPLSHTRSMCDVYANPVTNPVIYVQNSNDREFVTTHWWPFLDKADAANDIVYLTPKQRRGHFPLEKEAIISILSLATTAHTWMELTALLRGFAFTSDGC